MRCAHSAVDYLTDVGGGGGGRQGSGPWRRDMGPEVEGGIPIVLRGVLQALMCFVCLHLLEIGSGQMEPINKGREIVQY